MRRSVRLERGYKKRERERESDCLIELHYTKIKLVTQIPVGQPVFNYKHLNSNVKMKIIMYYSYSNRNLFHTERKITKYRLYRERGKSQNIDCTNTTKQ